MRDTLKITNKAGNVVTAREALLDGNNIVMFIREGMDLGAKAQGLVLNPSERRALAAYLLEGL